MKNEKGDTAFIQAIKEKNINAIFLFLDYIEIQKEIFLLIEKDQNGDLPVHIAVHQENLGLVSKIGSVFISITGEDPSEAMKDANGFSSRDLILKQKEARKNFRKKLEKEQIELERARKEINRLAKEEIEEMKKIRNDENKKNKSKVIRKEKYDEIEKITLKHYLAFIPAIILVVTIIFKVLEIYEQFFIEKGIGTENYIGDI